MKLKKLSLALLAVVIITTPLFSSAAYAQDEELPDPGITPDSPLYFMDNLGKQLGMAFTFGSEAKIRKALQYAEERLAEARDMALKNRIREEERATQGYGEFLAIATTKMEEVRNEGISDNISELVALTTSKHMSVLDRVKDNVPERAKEAIARAFEESMNGQQNALRLLSRERLERAMEINLGTVEDRLNRAREKAEEDNAEGMEEALEDADRMFRFGEEISEVARGLGRDTTSVEQLVAEATSNHLDVLTEVYNRVPEQERAAIQNAIANTVANRERTVEALKNRGALGDIPEETVLPESIRQELEVRERERERISESDNGTSERERSEAQVEEKVRSSDSVNTADSANTTDDGDNTDTKREGNSRKP